MQSNLINTLKNIVALLAGQLAVPLVDILYGKKDVNEFFIAKKLKLTINQTRNILYKLADEGVVSFIKKKDRKKGGWYIYFWTLNTGKGLTRLKEHLTKALEDIKTKLQNKKTQRFFNCKNCDIEVTEESALSSNYLCTECGEVLQLSERGKEVDALEKEVARIESILAGVDKELAVIAGEEETKKTKRIKAEEKKKSKERAIRKKIREKEKAKIIKYSKKTKSAKKTAKPAKSEKPAKTSSNISLGSKLRKLFR